jgi:hypothetical protein
MRTARAAASACACAVAALAGSPPASAADPGLWIKTGQLIEPSDYRQGIASNPATSDVFFSGFFAGLYRTRSGGAVLASNTNPIPKDVADREQYNHIGDVAFDAAEGGRLLLPLESYQPFAQDQNPSKTGSIGVADARTLQWKYYVKLDPAEIQKTQWVAGDPQQGLVWTIAGHDLLAYRLADMNPANAAPNAAPIQSVRRLAEVAPNGAGGAYVYRGRIYISTQAGTVDQIVSIDEATGASRVEIELPANLEPEGLDFGPYLGGLLHWELVAGGSLASPELLNFVPKGARLALALDRPRVRAGRQTTLSATARVLTGAFEFPLREVQIRLAGKSARTDANGRAKLIVKLTRGNYRAQAFYPGLRTASKRLRAK